MFSLTGACVGAADEGECFMACMAVLPGWCILYFVDAPTFFLSRGYIAEIKYSVYL